MTPLAQAKIVFPTHVGMNRMRNCDSYGSISVPHSRGDEPGLDDYLQNVD